jgi:hypothetical protein
VGTRIPLAVLVAVIALVTVACGDADGGDSTRAVEIEMRDIAFAPDAITVKRSDSSSATPARWRTTPSSVTRWRNRTTKRR